MKELHNKYKRKFEEYAKLRNKINALSKEVLAEKKPLQEVIEDNTIEQL